MTPIPSYEELLIEAEDRLRELVPELTNFSESSLATALLKCYMAPLAALYERIQEVEEQSQLSTAYGEYLERIGALFGISRLTATKASTQGMGAALQFTNHSEEAVTIPAGTRVYDPSYPDRTYLTTTTLTDLGPGAVGYAHAEAAFTGAYFNAGAHTLRAHNLGNDLIDVTNVVAITNGAGVETDENLRYRIANAVTAMQGANATAVRMAILEVPGVRDVVLRPLARGTGTLDVVIVPRGRHVSPELLAACEEALESVVALGISTRVLAPRERQVRVDLQVLLTPEGSADSAIAAQARALAGAQVRELIDNLPLEDGTGAGSLVYNQLIDRAMEVPYVRDVTLDLFIDGAPVLQTNHTPEPGERFVVSSVNVR